MFPKILIGLLIVAAATAIPTSHHVAPRTDLGAPLKDLINGLLSGMTGPVRIIPSIKMDDVGSLISELLNGAASPIKGSLHLEDISIVGIDKIQVTDSVLDYVLLKPLGINIAAGASEVCFEAKHTTDLLLMSLIPMRGSGKFSGCIEAVSGGYAGSLKLVMPFAMKEADYQFGLGAIKVQFDGLLGNGDLDETISRIINDIINATIVPAIITMEASLHESCIEILNGAINKVLSHFTLSDLMKIIGCLLNPNAEGCKPNNPPPAEEQMLSKTVSKYQHY